MLVHLKRRLSIKKYVLDNRHDLVKDRTCAYEIMKGEEIMTQIIFPKKTLSIVFLNV